MPTITILFTKINSIYETLNVDCWNHKRDARRWPGGNACIAHPPCRSWGNYHWKSQHTQSEKDLAKLAIHKIRLYGGILEHPRTSKLWKEMNLPLPGKPDQYGGYTILINQSWFGHRAEKKTFLYIVGIPETELPNIPYSLDAITKGIQYMGKAERERTPIQLCKWLIHIAEKIEQKKLCQK